MGSLKEKFEKVAEGKTAIVMHPDMIEKLKAEGVEFTVVPSQTIGEAFDERFLKALEVAYKLPPLPEGLPGPAQVLYQEVRECILFGLYGAAITLSSILVEYMLKFASFIVENNGASEWDASKWDEYEEIQFYVATEKAKSAGLLTPELEVELNSFRTVIRNPYAHYNIQKITSTIGFGKATVMGGNGESVERTVDPREAPGLQVVAKAEIDKIRFLVVFRFADKVSKHLISELEKRYNKTPQPTALAGGG